MCEGLIAKLDHRHDVISGKFYNFNLSLRIAYASFGASSSDMSYGQGRSSAKSNETLVLGSQTF